MNTSEAQEQSKRIERFKALVSRREEIERALQKVVSDDKAGPHGQGPFTGNSRESRTIHSLRIEFSPTRGGAQPVEMEIWSLGIEAYDLGVFLAEKIRRKLSEINKQIELL